MRARSHSEESEDTGIDLAPMLDFVLNLLIFFIITTSFVKEAGISVTKPEALTAEHKDNGNILIAIRPNGDIWMDKRRVDIREVRPSIERLHHALTVRRGWVGIVALGSASRDGACTTPMRRSCALRRGRGGAACRGRRRRARTGGAPSGAPSGPPTSPT